MRIYHTVLLALGGAVTTMVLSVTSSTGSLMLALFVPVALGASHGLCIWSALLRVLRRRAGLRRNGLSAFAVACLVLMGIVESWIALPLMLAGASVTVLGALVALLSFIVLQAAPRFGWERHPR